MPKSKVRPAAARKKIQWKRWLAQENRALQDEILRELLEMQRKVGV